MSKKKNLSDLAITLVFIMFIGVFFLLNLITKDRLFSEQENRYLQQLPVFTVRSLASGSFTEDFETYCSDQFFARDFWISWKARAELAQGKAQNNGYYLCDGDRILEPFHAPSSNDLGRRVLAIDQLGKNIEIPVVLGLIPTSAEIYSELFPYGARNDSQLDTINRVYSGVSVDTIDILSPLADRRAEEIYYRTDHHWTSLGAFYAADAILDSLGAKTPQRGAGEPQIVSEDFCGTYYSSSGFFWTKPDRMFILRDDPGDLTVTRYETAAGTDGSLYSPPMLETKDKYRFFLGGNTPRVVIETGHSDLPRLMIIRDSYSDSLVPFLLDSFSEIHLIDLRYYRESIRAYVENNAIDKVLVLYSVDNFCTDTNFMLMGT